MEFPACCRCSETPSRRTDVSGTAAERKPGRQRCRPVCASASPAAALSMHLEGIAHAQWRACCGCRAALGAGDCLIAGAARGPAAAGSTAQCACNSVHARSAACSALHAAAAAFAAAATTAAAGTRAIAICWVAASATATAATGTTAAAAAAAAATSAPGCLRRRSQQSQAWQRATHECRGGSQAGCGRCKLRQRPGSATGIECQQWLWQRRRATAGTPAGRTAKCRTAACRLEWCS